MRDRYTAFKLAVGKVHVCLLLGKALCSGCDARRTAKLLLLIAILNYREFVCGRMHKIVDTTAAFRLAGRKVYMCVLLLSVSG
jgi:hypothetical protein